MTKFRVKVKGSGKLGDPYRVNLPTYFMVAGSEKFSKKGKLVSVEVEVPDDECTEGRLDKDKIRRKYKGQPLWDRENLLSDVT